MEAHPPLLDDYLDETSEGIFHFGMPQFSVNPSIFLMRPYPCHLFEVHILSFSASYQKR